MIGRRMGTAAVVVAAITVGGVVGAVMGVPGLSGASSTTTTPKSSTEQNAGHHRGFPGLAFGHGDVLDAGAKALNLSTKDLLTKLSDGKTTISDIATQQKVKLQDVIDAMEKVANDDISKLVTTPFPVRPHFDGKGKGPKGGLGFGFGFGFRGRVGGSLDSAAKALGLSTKDLLTQLAGGKSIADLVKAKNLDLNTFIDGLVNDAKTRIDAAVTAKHLTQDQATKIESTLKDTITKFVNNAFPKFPKGGHHFGGFGHHGKGGKGPEGGTGPGGGSGALAPTSTN